MPPSAPRSTGWSRRWRQPAASHSGAAVRAGGHARRGRCPDRAALAARISDLGAEERILKRLGLIAGAADYTKLWAADPSATPIATYDARAQRLMVPDFLPLDSQRVALIHEIAHAVADQRFDLRQFLTPPPPSPLEGDSTRARLALVEGDATLTAMEVVDPTGAFLRPTAFNSVTDCAARRRR